MVKDIATVSEERRRSHRPGGASAPRDEHDAIHAAEGVLPSPHSLVDGSRPNARGNGLVYAALMLQLQQAYGNRVIQRFIQRQAGSSAGIAQKKALKEQVLRIVDKGSVEEKLGIVELVRKASDAEKGSLYFDWEFKQALRNQLSRHVYGPVIGELRAAASRKPVLSNRDQKSDESPPHLQRFRLKYPNGQERLITKEDKEFRGNYIDYNIVEGATIVKIDTGDYNTMTLKYDDGRELVISLHDVPLTYSPESRGQTRMGTLGFVDYYEMGTDGFIRPMFDGKPRFDNRNTPEIVYMRSQVFQKAKALKDLYLLMELGATFANLIGASAGMHVYSSHPPAFVPMRRPSATPKTQGGGRPPTIPDAPHAPRPTTDTDVPVTVKSSSNPDSPGTGHSLPTAPKASGSSATGGGKAAVPGGKGSASSGGKGPKGGKARVQGPSQAWKGQWGPAPERAERVVAHAKKNNGAARPNHAGNRPFANDGRDATMILPTADKDGNPVSYREYDVNSFVKGQNRGAERVVIGSDGSAYYTSDHYNTFYRFQ